MRIADMLARSKPSISFEFMAPRDESEVDVMERTVAALAGHAPDWVSVTYRVRTGEKTLELVTRIKRHYHIEAMAHLTCANTADRTRQILNWMEREGVANVLAPRGEPPCRRTCSPRSTRLPTTTPSAPSACGTASRSARSCSKPACRACTSTRSTGHAPRSRSSPRCAASNCSPPRSARRQPRPTGHEWRDPGPLIQPTEPEWRYPVRNGSPTGALLQRM